MSITSQAVQEFRTRLAGLAGGRPIALVAVSKTQAAGRLREAHAAGLQAFGENYLQEALAKQAELADLAIEWHFIGPLQSNKTRPVAEHFDWVHSVDRLKLAAMLNHLNENFYGHILTVEDPIEFVHESKRCLVNQRELGAHTLGFSEALRSALREDPDYILVGEMRDLETIRLALTAAETGHLVFGTLHTSSAPKTIDRIIDVFPAGEKEMVRAMLSESMRAVISQTLLKTRDGQGRVAAYEVMIGTPAIRNLIREGKVAQMYSSIQTGQSLGMQTLDQSLQDLVRRGLVSAGEARTYAASKEQFAA